MTKRSLQAERAGAAPARGCAVPLVAVSVAAWLVGGCVLPPVSWHPSPASAPEVPRPSDSFIVRDEELPMPLVLITYGDMRFTDPAERKASNPTARRALVAQVATEQPAGIFVNGDLTWHGVPADYAVFHDETAVWRDLGTRVYPALGNHEFSGCESADCLKLWWAAFPVLEGRRWYSVALGSRVMAVVLDSNAPLLPGTEQRGWLEAQMADLDRQVRVVLVVLHHPPLADVQTTKITDHNPRPNEQSLADYLESLSQRSRARFIVSAGHIHNYERLERGGVVYLVSGGGGARPYEVDRTTADLYQSAGYPNFHYVRLQLGAKSVVGEMVRLENDPAAAPAKWQIRDRFELTLPP